MAFLLIMALLAGGSHIDWTAGSTDDAQIPAVVKEDPFARGKLYSSADGYLISNLSTPPKTTCYEVRDETAEVQTAIAVCDVEEVY